MAHKPTSFKLNEKKKEIVVYTNVEAPEEKKFIDIYVGQGYKPMFEEKKPAKTVEQMRKDLEKDAETLARFNEAYAEKNGFFNACKIYSEWNKKNKKEKKAK